jgi:hypothetical protein
LVPGSYMGAFPQSTVSSLHSLSLEVVVNIPAETQSVSEYSESTAVLAGVDTSSVNDITCLRIECHEQIGLVAKVTGRL